MGHVEITTVIPCINACRFCPQGVLLSAYKDDIGDLTLINFTQLLSKIPKNYNIHFSGFSEPFLNRDSSKMIAHASNQGYSVSLFSTLVGLTQEDVYIMEDVKWEGITLHVPDDWNFIVDDIDEWIEHYKLFTSYFKVKSANYYIGNADEKVLSQCNVQKTSNGCLTSRCNNVNPDVIPHIERIKGDINCISGGHTPVLLPNGDMIICCMDWGLKHKLGNLFQDSFEDLFNSNEFNKIKASWTDESIDSICRYCRR